MVTHISFQNKPVFLSLQWELFLLSTYALFALLHLRSLPCPHTLLPLPLTFLHLLLTLLIDSCGLQQYGLQSPQGLSKCSYFLLGSWVKHKTIICCKVIPAWLSVIMPILRLTSPHNRGEEQRSKWQQLAKQIQQQAKLLRGKKTLKDKSILIKHRECKRKRSQVCVDDLGLSNHPRPQGSSWSVLHPEATLLQGATWMLVACTATRVRGDICDPRA